MKLNHRRPVLMLIIISVGCLLITLNQPLIVVLSGTVLAGCIALIITGSVDLSVLIPEKFRKKETVKTSAKSGKKTIGQSSGAKKESRLNKIKGKYIPKRLLVYSNKFAVMVSGSAVIGKVRSALPEHNPFSRSSREKKKLELEKINAALDSSVGGSPEISKSEDADDPMNDLLDVDLDDLGDDIFDEISLDEDESSAVSGLDFDELDSLDVEDADSVDDILKAYGADPDELDDETSVEGSADDEIGFDELGDVLSVEEFESMDLDDLELDDDLDSLEIEGESTGDETPIEEAIPEEPPEVEQPEEVPDMGVDMVSFAEGFTEDDMISQLKSETKKKRKKVDTSLLRDLKDVKINVNELADEMEETLKMLG